MSENMAYVAIRPSCGHIVGAAVDIPDHAKIIAKEVARWIGAGLRIERQPLADVKAAAWCVKPCPEARK